jgi:hypothetical protein
MRRLRTALSPLLLSALLATGCAATRPAEPVPSMDEIAKGYVRLVLAVGRHDPEYVDAYYGPPKWRAEAEARDRSLPDLRADADALLVALERQPVGPGEGADGVEMERRRRRFLARQLEAVAARIDLLAGREMSFDEELRALYDAVAPRYGLEYFEETLDRLEESLPGEGHLAGRLGAL